MITPRQDKEMREEIASYLYKCFGAWIENSYYDLSKTNKAGWQEYAMDILEKMEAGGYHKGLPPSIEEALNSGDGVYRP
jgi:hypothetical protein